LSSRKTENASPDGLKCTSRRSLETSMPTKTARCLSMTLLCKCGLGPERRSGCGTGMVEAATSSVSGFRAPGRTRAGLHVQPRRSRSSGQLRHTRRFVERYSIVKRVQISARLQPTRRFRRLKTAILSRPAVHCRDLRP
jgi:hypothetical protein